MNDVARAMISWIGSLGVRVDLNADLPTHVLGRCHNRQRDGRELIQIAKIDSEIELLITIAHEAGHLFGNRRRFLRHKYQRERQAFVYGWRILRIFEAPITRAQWIEAHRGCL